MDRSLVERARHGDIDAFEDLIRSRMTSVYRLALGVLGSEQDARDATQEAFISAWRGLGGLREPERFDAWLRRIALNACRGVLRKRSRAREIRLTEMASSGTVDDRTGAREDAAWLDAAFGHLTVEERALLTLHHLDGRGLVEIGAIIGVPVGTVKSRLWAARRNLQRALINEGTMSSPDWDDERLRRALEHRVSGPVLDDLMSDVSWGIRGAPDAMGRSRQPYLRLAAAVIGVAVVASLGMSAVLMRPVDGPQGGLGAQPSPGASTVTGSSAPTDEPLPTGSHRITPGPYQELSEQQSRAVNKYGREHADVFGGVYIDSAGGGVVALFTRDADAHRGALEALLPTVPIRTETVRFTEAELQGLQDRIAREHDRFAPIGFQVYSSSIDIFDNVVELTGGTTDPRAVARIHERYGSDMLRVIAEPVVPEPEQPLEGEGWRLLAEMPRGGTYSVAAFTTAPSFEGEWRRLRAGDLPVVDFSREIVIRFSPALSGSCRQIHFAGVVVEDDRVYGDITFPVPSGMGCTADATPYAFVVAVEQAILPDSPFTLQLFEEIVGSVEDQRITVDLRP